MDRRWLEIGRVRISFRSWPNSCKSLEEEDSARGRQEQTGEMGREVARL